MLRIIALYAIFLSVFSAVPAMASQSCYSTKEAEAEQGLRIHSELMVIGLNCQSMPLFAKKNLYGKYRDFTSDHAALFEAYEKILLSYYTRKGDVDPPASLNTLRTVLANSISQDAASMRPDVFCARYAPRIDKASAMSLKDIRRWASTFYPSHPVSEPFCDTPG